MTSDIFLSALLFATVTAFTPGPNNAMLMASGVNHGLRPTIPHISGVVIGYCIMFVAVGLGIGRLFALEPRLYTALQIVSAAYLIWLAWRIATSASEGPASAGTESKPLTFLEAALFQWVNPKGLAGALAAASNYIDPRDLVAGLSILTAIMFVVSLAAATTWTLFGEGLRGFLADAHRRVIFNRVMAILLVASLWPIFAAAHPVAARP